MNKEIKNIINNIKSYENEELCLIFLSQKENKALLNYITNLQEENKMYAQLKEEYEDIIDKALEYINTHYLNANETELLNILQGDDENETNS